MYTIIYVLCIPVVHVHMFCCILVVTLYEDYTYYTYIQKVDEPKNTFPENVDDNCMTFDPTNFARVRPKVVQLYTITRARVRRALCLRNRDGFVVIVC